MSLQFEKSSHKIVSVLRRQHQEEGLIIHRSDHGIIHETIKPDKNVKQIPPLRFVRTKSRGDSDKGILEKTEIEDLGKVYQEIKQNLKIGGSTEVTVRYAADQIITEEKQEQPVNLTMNKTMIREMYFKQREQQKLKKINSSVEKQIRAKSVQGTPSCSPAVNNKILNFVKTKNRLSYESNSLQKYWSEIDRCGEDTNYARAGNFSKATDYDIVDMDYERSNIISLRTGLPVKPYVKLNTFMQQLGQKEKYQDTTKKQESRGSQLKRPTSYSINLPNGESRIYSPNASSIVTSLNDYFNLMEGDKKSQPKKRVQQSIKASFEGQTELQAKGLGQRYLQLKKKVENNEASLVDQCETFLKMKRRKNIQFLNLIQTVNRDRPITQSIRMREYSSKDNEGKLLTQLRRSAEKKRQNLMFKNMEQHRWYESTLECIAREREDQDELDTCNYIFETLKTILEDGKQLSQRHAYQIFINVENNPKTVYNKTTLSLIRRIMEYLEIELENLKPLSKMYYELNLFMFDRQTEVKSV